MSKRIKTGMSLILLKENKIVYRNIIGLDEKVDFDKMKEKYDADQIIYKPFYAGKRHRTTAGDIRKSSSFVWPHISGLQRNQHM